MSLLIFLIPAAFDWETVNPLDNAQQTIITFKNITKSYENGENVIEGFNLSIRRGEFVTLLGPSGCGKTTLLRMIGGFELPTSGELLLNGRDISRIPSNERPINTVFQSYALFPFLNIYDNIAFGLKIRKKPEAEIRRKVQDVLRIVDLEGFENRRVRTLSGGQQQRVAIARAIINEPQILLLDEPLSALDYKMRQEMQLELREMHRELGITFVFVTHDQEEAMTMSDRIVVLSDGKVQQVGTPEEIYKTPNNLFVADFIGNSNIFNGNVTKPGIVTFLDTPFTCSTDLPEGTPIRAVIRPENVKLTEIPAPADRKAASFTRTEENPRENEPLCGEDPRENEPLRGGNPHENEPLCGENAPSQPLVGTVTETIFKGDGYEATVQCGRSEITANVPHSIPAHTPVGISFLPGTIHLIRADESRNHFRGVVDQDGLLETEEGVFLPRRFEPALYGRRVEAFFEPADAKMSDDAEKGFVTGHIMHTIYVGDHYVYSVRSENDRDYFVDDEWLWNIGDRVSVFVAAEDVHYRVL